VEDWRCLPDLDPLGRVRGTLSKSNRQKGVKREKYRFTCENHDPPFRGPVRFVHEEGRKDWVRHNILEHNRVK